MIRSVWAILTGFILIGVLNFGTEAIVQAMSPWAFDDMGGTTSLPILLMSIVSSAVYGVVGCYITARLAPFSPMKHAMILGAIGVLTTAYLSYSLRGHVPAWYSIINVALVLPLAWFGGRLRENEMGAKG